VGVTKCIVHIQHVSVAEVADQCFSLLCASPKLQSLLIAYAAGCQAAAGSGGAPDLPLAPDWDSHREKGIFEKQ
jgi:hypothetical protein